MSEKKQVTAIANGRVNLIGEHTDYNDGWVLPTAIPQKTTISLKPNSSQTVRARSRFESKAQAEFTLGQERKTGTWIDYIQGGTKILTSLGFKFSGFDLEIDSTVPVGSGLSSSAALEVALMKAIREAFALDLNDLTLARAGQRIENEFVGANVGIMDQMACTLAQWGEALFLDTQSLDYQRVKLPLDEMDLIVLNSGISHRLTDGGYNQRRSECEQACKALGVKSLREMKVQDLNQIEELPDVLCRRARHVVTENDRVHQAVSSIEKRDLRLLGKLFLESHASMRDDYQVSLPEIDLLVKLAAEQDGAFGARLTGGGFGGSIVALAEKGSGEAIARQVAAEYQKQTQEKPTILIS